MSNRCPHGLLKGSSLCVIPSCEEYDGMGSVENNVQKAKFTKRTAKQAPPRLCGHCGERPRMPRRDYCKVCHKRFCQPKGCEVCGVPLVLKEPSKFSEHVRRTKCIDCLRNQARTENSLYVRGLGVPHE